MVEWSRALDVRLSEWCCSVSMVWVQIPSREEQKIDSFKILILTLFGLIFRRTCIYIYGADVVEWSRALDIRLCDCCCSVSIV